MKSKLITAVSVSAILLTAISTAVVTVGNSTSTPVKAADNNRNRVSERNTANKNNTNSDRDIENRNNSSNSDSKSESDNNSVADKNTDTLNRASTSDGNTAKEILKITESMKEANAQRKKIYSALQSDWNSYQEKMADYITDLKQNTQLKSDIESAKQGYNENSTLSKRLEKEYQKEIEQVQNENDNNFLDWITDRLPFLSFLNPDRNDSIKEKLSKRNSDLVNSLQDAKKKKTEYKKLVDQMNKAIKKSDKLLKQDKQQMDSLKSGISKRINLLNKDSDSDNNSDSSNVGNTSNTNTEK